MAGGVKRKLLRRTRDERRGCFAVIRRAGFSAEVFFGRVSISLS